MSDVVHTVLPPMSDSFVTCPLSSTSVSLAVMMPLTPASTITDRYIHEPASSLPEGVTGALSPYPTVVSVTRPHHMPSSMPSR